MSFEDAKSWYDGYDFPDVGAIYNPYSVTLAMLKKKFGSYWQKTSAAESLMIYINMDFEGLQETISRLISGEEIEVNTDFFENDFETFKSRDDVLTLLIHLGYLAWHEEDGTVRIPNEEVRIEFRKILKSGNMNPKWMELLGHSEKLLKDTIAGNGEAVAKSIEALRDTQYAPTFYNNEQALLVVELKWNRSPEGAIRQMKERNYPAVLKSYEGEIVLVGINYDAKKKEHSCVIERI